MWFIEDPPSGTLRGPRGIFNLRQFMAATCSPPWVRLLHRLQRSGLDLAGLDRLAAWAQAATAVPSFAPVAAAAGA